MDGTLIEDIFESLVQAWDICEKKNGLGCWCPTGQRFFFEELTLKLQNIYIVKSGRKIRSC